jgi:hypothetical protein
MATDIDAAEDRHSARRVLPLIGTLTLTFLDAAQPAEPQHSNCLSPRK